jgi:hypothetical protein
MTISNATLVGQFLDGDTNVGSSSLSVVEGDHGYTVLTSRTSLCGYAARNPSGKLVVFSGWANQNVSEDAPRDGFSDPYEHAGSHTTKSKHFKEIPWEDADILVAYDEASTEMEQELLDLADEVTNDPERAAPKPLEASKIARELILPPVD